MMRVPVRLLLVLALMAVPLGRVHASGSAGDLLPRSESVREVFRLAQGYSCTSRRYCSKKHQKLRRSGLVPRKLLLGRRT